LTVFILIGPKCRLKCLDVSNSIRQNLTKIKNNKIIISEETFTILLLYFFTDKNNNPLGKRQLEQHLMSSSKRLCPAAGKCFDPPFQMAI
jgi:hypothetical protein